jgi:hypothetical protein
MHDTAEQLEVANDTHELDDEPDRAVTGQNVVNRPRPPR